MFKSVVTKLWITIFALILGILFIFSLFLSNRLEKIYFSHQVKLMSEHAQQWKTILLTGLSSEKIQREMEFWGRVSNYKIIVLDDRGIIRYSSDITSSPPGEKSNWTHVKAGIENREDYYTGFNPELNMKMTATFLPFADSQGKKYLIMIHTPTHDLMEMIRATRTTGFWILLFFLVVSGILGWYFSRWIAKPLINIREIALGMAKCDFSTLAETNRNDELGDLAKTMNSLSTRLKMTLNSLSTANSELNALLRKWKEFVADVSHELRTPLFLIQGYSEAVMDNVVNDEQTKNEYLTVINKETLRLQKLVNDLIAVESGLPLHKAPTSLYNLACDAVTPFEIKARDKKVAIEVSKPLKAMEPVYIDPDKLREVIYNLVDNALRHTPVNGKITITGAPDGPDGIKLTVTDTGTGIPVEHIPHLFDRFYRVDKSRSRIQGGTGLGLAIVKKIVEQHRGKITVESKLNRGTSFIITIPVRQVNTS